MNNSLVDLHIHSNASDGTDDVNALLDNLRNAGIKTFSLTDHDTIEGVLKMENIVPKDMTFICGVEFSCATAVGKCHILAYGYDKGAPAFKQILNIGKEKRRNKLLRRLDFLKNEFNIEIPEQQKKLFLNQNSVGKPHLGNLLVSMGLAGNKNEAIEKYIDPCKTESDRIDAIETIKAIISAGGIPVWAHPYGGTGEREVSQQKFNDQLNTLIPAGLKGLECYYSKYNETQVASLLKTARESNLLVSGGSDYHGANKNIAPGALNSYNEIVKEENLSVLSKLIYNAN